MASISSVRSFLYWLARLLGDITAILRGRVGQRVVRRLAGKLTGRALWRLFRVVAFALLVAGPGWAGEGESSPEGVTAIMPSAGTVRIEADRLDIFRHDGSRDGYGIRRGDGSWDLYRKDGSRLGTITPGIGGQPGRVTVPKGRK